MPLQYFQVRIRMFNSTLQLPNTINQLFLPEMIRFFFHVLQQPELSSYGTQSPCLLLAQKLTQSTMDMLIRATRPKQQRQKYTARRFS